MARREVPEKGRQRPSKRNLVKVRRGLVAKYMDYAGLSRKELARQAGVDPGSVGRALNGGWITAVVAGSIRDCLNREVKKRHDEGTLSRTKAPLLTSLSEWPRKDAIDATYEIVGNEGTRGKGTTLESDPAECPAVGVLRDSVREFVEACLGLKEGPKERVYVMHVLEDGSVCVEEVRDSSGRTVQTDGKTESYLRDTVKMLLSREKEARMTGWAFVARESSKGGIRIVDISGCRYRPRVRDLEPRERGLSRPIPFELRPGESDMETWRRWMLVHGYIEPIRLVKGSSGTVEAKE